MREYTRKHRTTSKSAGNEMNSSAAQAGNIPNSSMEAIMAGRARASSEMMGHRQDLAPSLNAKMSKAFGMDLTNVQVYRTNAMQGTETKGMASGNKIVLSKDIDLNTTAGQAVLGHELSHVRAQNQGIGIGHSGLYQNAGLEHQADVEGMMAARGQSILGESTGMDMGLGMGGIGGLTPLGAGMSASAGAPMQAKDKPKKNKAPKTKPQSYKDVIAPFMANENDINLAQYNELAKSKGLTQGQGEFADQGMKLTRNDDAAEVAVKNLDKQNGKLDSTKTLGNAFIGRLYGELMGSAVNSTKEEMDALTENLAKGDTIEAQKFTKRKAYESLLAKEKKFGNLLEQMDVRDLYHNGGQKGFAAPFYSGMQLRDASQGTDGDLTDKEKARYKQLNDYFEGYLAIMSSYSSGYVSDKEIESMKATWLAENKGVIQGGPFMNKKQLKAYRKSLKGKEWPKAN